MNRLLVSIGHSINTVAEDYWKSRSILYAPQYKRYTLKQACNQDAVVQPPIANVANPIEIGYH
jgi:hypothetical protein